MLIYESAKLQHGRPTPLHADAIANAFLHYVPADEERWSYRWITWAERAPPRRCKQPLAPCAHAPLAAPRDAARRRKRNKPWPARDEHGAPAQGPHTSEECVAWAKQGQCADNPHFMRRACMFSCAIHAAEAAIAK